MTKAKTMLDVVHELDGLTNDYDDLAWFAFNWFDSYGRGCPSELRHLCACLDAFSDKLHALRGSAYEAMRAN